jgi:DNA-binding SARP family transcriptional activator
LIELQVELLGGFRARRAGGAEIRVGSRKAQALLACLAMQPGTRFSREYLAGLLWEDSEPELARASLRQALSALRRVLPERVGGGLQGDGQTVALDPGLVTSDVARFRLAARTGTADALGEPASVPTGLLLEGFDARSAAFAEWLDERRRELRREQLQALDRCRTHARSCGQVEREIEALERLTALEPTNERAHRGMIDAYARAGRYTDAVRQFRVCRDTLRRELDVAPEPATESLFREVLRRRRADPSSSATTSATDHGVATEVASPPVDDDSVGETLRELVVLSIRPIAVQHDADPERVRSDRREIETLGREVVLRHGGVIDWSADGDGIAVFGLHAATGHEPEHGARAALEIASAVGSAGLAVAIGFAQGRALPSGQGRVFPLTGEPVRVARDLARAAASGEVVVTAELAGDLERHFELETSRAVPGASSLHRAVERGVSTTRFAGRRAELAMLGTLLERVIASRRGRAVVIRGDAGIGKSALLAALAAESEAHGVAAHLVRVLDFGQSTRERPFPALATHFLGLPQDATDEQRLAAVEPSIASGALLTADRASLVELLGVEDPARGGVSVTQTDDAARERGRSRVLQRLLDALTQHRPQLVMVEDVHWADPVEVAQLADLAAAVATLPVLFAVTTRADGDPVNAAWRARARGCPVTTLDLAPLADDEARELAAAFEGLPADVVEHCIATASGNPLFLEQLLRAAQRGQSELPGSVRSLLLASIERLDASSRRALHAAAVLGARFPLNALRHVLADPVVGLDGLHEAGLLARDGDECHFAHALIRDAVYGSLLRSTRRDSHTRAAAWYESVDPGLQGDHLAAAGDETAALAYLRAATGEQKAQRLDRALSRALQARATAVHAADLFESCVVLGGVYLAKGRTDDAIAAYRESIDLAATGGGRARAWLGLAASLRVCDRYDEALAALTHAERGAAADDDPRLLAQLWTLRGNLHFPRGEIDACLAAHERAREYAERSGSPDDLARSLGGLGDAQYQRCHMHTARRLFADCVALSEQHGLAGLRLAYLPMLAVAAGYMGDYRTALRVAEDAIAIARSIGDPRAELLGLSIRGNVQIARGEYADAETACARSTELAHAIGARRFEAEAMALQALALRHLNRRDEALPLATQAAELARDVCPTYCGPWACAVLAAITEDPAACRTLLDEGERLLENGCVSHNHLDFRPIAIDVCLRHGDTAAALQHAAALERYTADEPLAPSTFHVDRARLLVEARGAERAPALAERLTAALARADALELRTGAVDLRRTLMQVQGTV